MRHPSSELQREREVQRLYQGWRSAQGSSLNVALNVDSIAQADLHGTGYKPHVSQDRALTAFAQLAVLKLNVRRAMVSLIDRDVQMILAESTDNVGIGSDSEKDLWLGSTLLTRSDAVCEHAMTNTYTAHDPNDDSITYTAPALVIADCRYDARFETRPYVLSEPGVRFYAGVPIVSPLGHRIGVYAVSDETPRPRGLSIEELKFMEGVARTVMDHLEAARDRVDRFKGERIVRGLAAFIEGSSNEESPLGRRSSTMSTNSTRRRTLARQASYNREEVNVQQPPEQPESSPAASLPTPTETTTSADKTAKPDPSAKTSSKTHSKGDALSQMYSNAVEVLRQSTLADGVVLFGASPSNSKHQLRRMLAGGLRASSDDDVSASMTSGSEGLGLDSSDSDTSPSARPCKILACALADKKARADIEQGSALTLGALEKYFDMFPRGKTFSFTSEGAGISSEEDSASDRDTSAPSDTNSTGGSRRRHNRMDHRELLKKIPGARAVVFVPLYSATEDRFAGGVFLWTSVTGRMMNMDDDLSYLRAFSSSIMSEVSRINAQKDEAAKTTFIASISHELRSPLHGILGAAEFLMDTAVDSYQSGLVTSVATCGKTLLDTMNHLLDYSKINRLGPKQIRRNARRNKISELPPDKSLESMNMTAVVDLAILVEEVVDAVTAGNTFDKLPGTVLSKVSKSNVSSSTNTMSLSKEAANPAAEGPVSVLLDICPRASWMVRTQPGALRRIIMNLLGNALKYTSSGFVQVSLRAQEHGFGDKARTSAVIKVVDTGKGMSDEFQRDRLFVPFSQEDSFQPGTGLGLSIVKQIVDSLGGSIEVESEHSKGTEVIVRLNLNTVSDDAPPQPDEEMDSIAQRTRGQKLVVLNGRHATHPGHPNHKLDHSLASTCSEWFGLKAVRNPQTTADADLILYCVPPTVEALQEEYRSTSQDEKSQYAPVVIICANAKEAIRISQNQGRTLAGLGRVVEVIPQPLVLPHPPDPATLMLTSHSCGPRKLAKVFSHCLSRRDDLLRLPTQPGHDQHQDTADLAQRNCLASPSSDVPEIRVQNGDLPPSPPTTNEDSRGSPFEAHVNLSPPAGTSLKLTQPSPPPLDPTTPPLEEIIQKTLRGEKDDAQGNRKPPQSHVLLVDDNKINLQLLVMLMKKCGCTYEQAENGQEALDSFIAGHRPTDDVNTSGRPFDYVLMDINMPVMNGLEATRRIRDHERENGLTRTNVIALTGLASDDAQRDAKASGVDVFLPKPVKFAELKKILVTKE